MRFIDGEEEKDRNEASGWILFNNLRCNLETFSSISNASNIDLHQCMGFKSSKNFSFHFKSSFRKCYVFLTTIAIQRTQILVRTIRRTGYISTWTRNLPKIHPERPFDMRISINIWNLEYMRQDFKFNPRIVTKLQILTIYLKLVQWL